MIRPMEMREIWAIYVEPFMKRQGIGSAMIEFCEKKAIERGFKEICLWTLEKSVESRSFYEKNGFSTDGEIKMRENIGTTEIRYTKAVQTAREQ